MRVVLRLPTPLIVTLLAASVACTPSEVASPPSATVSAAVRAPAYPVVVTLVVDQLAAWIAYERLGELGMNGGFARLRREGTWVGAMRYEHAVTDTGPGHGALYTGAVPAASGIFANEVLDETGEPQSILRDPATRLITADGTIDRAGSSLGRLRVETLADRLRAEHPDAVISRCRSRTGARCSAAAGTRRLRSGSTSRTTAS